jgi:hypothetical protein
MDQPARSGTREDDLRVLEEAAARKDISGFGRAQEAIDWAAHQAEDIIRAMDLALEVGAYGTARTLSEIGARQFPDHEVVRKYARILGPAKILRTGLPPDPGAAADIRWLKKHSSEYRGRWVALKDGELLESADSFEQLLQKYPARSGVLLTHIG